MPPTETEQLVSSPDARLQGIIEDVQRIATQTQSEAYQYVTIKEHPDIVEGDVIEVRCAPTPLITAEEGITLPPAQPQWDGFVCQQGDELKRCHATPEQVIEGEPSSAIKAQVDGDPSLSLSVSGDGEPGDWRVMRFEWVIIDPSWKERAMAPEDDVQLKAFPGLAAEGGGSFTVHTDMALGGNPPIQN